MNDITKDHNELFKYKLFEYQQFNRNGDPLSSEFSIQLEVWPGDYRCVGVYIAGSTGMRVFISDRKEFPSSYFIHYRFEKDRIDTVLEKLQEQLELMPDVKMGENLTVTEHVYNGKPS